MHETTFRKRAAWDDRRSRGDPSPVRAARRGRFRAWLTIAAASLLVTAAAAGSIKGTPATSGTAAQFDRQMIEWIGKNDWGAMYGVMHPAEQQVIAYRDFDRCMIGGTAIARKFGTDVSSMRFLRARVEPPTRTVTVPGTHVRAVATVVSDVVTIVQGGKRITQRGDPQYFVRVGGTWRWIETDTTPADFKRAGCGIG